MGKILQQLCTSSKLALTSPRLIIRFVIGFQLDYFRRCIPRSLKDVSTDGPFQRDYWPTGERKAFESEMVLQSTFQRFTQLLGKKKKYKKNKPVFTFDWQIKSLASLSTPGSFSVCLYRQIYSPFPDRPQRPNLATAPQATREPRAGRGRGRG